MVTANPHQTAVQLLTGANVAGDHKSVMNLDSSLANVDRLAYHRRKMLTHGTYPSRGGDKFVNGLAEFMRQHPDFVIHHQFSPTVLVVMQTRYMVTCMAEEILRGDARHGFVTDANHGFFVSDHKYLITTTAFSVNLRRWVPIFLAYSGGQAEGDYREYFYQLFASMHRSLGTESNITDEHYAQVCFICLALYYSLLNSGQYKVVDFSQAQMAGFTHAFADWHLAQRGIAKEQWSDSSHDSDRNNYMRRSQALLKGCLVHFQRSVKMVAQSGSLVAPGAAPRFRNLCNELRSVPSVTQFRVIEADLRREFPSIKGWLDWWVRPAMSPKIFEAFKVMKPSLDTSLPDTTNPVESLHNILGVSVGQGHQILDGLNSLLAWVTRYELQNEAVKSAVDFLGYPPSPYLMFTSRFRWYHVRIWRSRPPSTGSQFCEGFR